MKWRKGGIRRKGIFWEYDGDGLFARERIKGAAKRYWRRWSRRMANAWRNEADREGPGSSF